jgi:hypothetical protein
VQNYAGGWEREKFSAHLPELGGIFRLALCCALQCAAALCCAALCCAVLWVLPRAQIVAAHVGEMWEEVPGRDVLARRQEIDLLLDLMEQIVSGGKVRDTWCHGSKYWGLRNEEDWGFLSLRGCEIYNLCSRWLTAQ